MNMLGPNDVPNRRTMDLGNNVLVAERDGGTGFWKVRLERGALPDYMQGSFTNMDEVRKIVTRYLQDKKRFVKEDKLKG